MSCDREIKGFCGSVLSERHRVDKRSAEEPLSHTNKLTGFLFHLLSSSIWGNLLKQYVFSLLSWLIFSNQDALSPTHSLFPLVGPS